MQNRREKQKRDLRYASARDRAEKHEKQFESTAVKVPQGTEVFRFTTAKTYRLDILPYQVKKGSDQPGGNPYADEGFLSYERTFYSHYIPTPEGNRYYCCPIKTFKERKCPICEYLAEGERSGTLDEQNVGRMKAKERQLFNVIDLDEKAKGIQLFEFNFWEFGRVLDEKVNAKQKYETFYYLEGGRTIEVTVKADHTFDTSRFKPFNIEFEEREDYPEETLDKTMDLDSLLKHIPYAELKQVFLEPSLPSSKEATHDVVEGEEEEEETQAAEEVAPTRNHRVPTVTKKWDEGDLVTYKNKEMEVLKVNKDGTLRLEWQNPDPKGQDRTFDHVDADDVAEYTPETPKKSTKVKSPPEDEDEDIEEEEPDEEDDFGDEDELEEEEDLDAKPKTPQKRRS